MPNKNPQFNDEIKFLITCCQTNPSIDNKEFIISHLNAERLTLLALNADTPVAKAQVGCNALIALAKQHGILPLIYKTLKKIVEDDSPRSPLNA